MADGAPGAAGVGPGLGAPAWQQAGLTALAYLAFGALALMLAGPPGFASPLFPSAGVALAATLVAGRSALVGVFVGATLLNAGLGAARGAEGWVTLLSIPALIGLGAVLQAQLGAWMVRRAVAMPLVLSEPREIARAGLLGGFLACTVSASVGTAALALGGVLDADDVLPNWSTWWMGDTVGVLITAPLVLTLIGQPRADWRPRRRTLALPLLAALAVLALGVHQLQQLDAAREAERFDYAATQLVAQVRQRLDNASLALKGLQSAARVAGRPLDEAGLNAASAGWLARFDALQATGVGQRVAEAGVAALENEARRQGRAEFRVVDRDGGSDRRERGELLVVRQLAPADRNRGDLGVNALSIDVARPAIEAARDSGQPWASAALALGQSGRDEPGVLLYQALYRPGATEPGTPLERRERWTGVVFISLSIELALAGIGERGRGRVSWCLLDADPSARLRRLAGSGEASACGPAADGHRHEQRLDWAGRSWLLRASAPVMPALRVSGEAGLLSLTGLAAATLLGALLLVVTGHTRRTVLAVAASTAQFRAEVAERRRAEAAQQETRERLQGILDNAPLGVLFLDHRGEVIEGNARFCQMTGLAPDRLVGTSVLEFAHPDDREPLVAVRRDLVAGAASRTVAGLRLQAPGEDGQWTPVRLIASALRDDNGRVLRVVAVVEDVADQLRLQASEQARQRAEEANRAKNEFLSRMSHELRTPLNAMIGFAQLLGMDRDPALAPHQQEWVRLIQRAGWHLLDLINETLDLSRIESGSVSLALEPVDMRALAEAALALVASAASQRGIQIEVIAEPGVPAAMGDAMRLRQVLTNLLTNAIKYNRPGGSVRVHVARAGNTAVRVAVRDTGLGMDAAQMERLFQPYNRLGREHSGIEGTGIGLVISQGLLGLMGGSLAVESQLAVGSTFTFTLPATHERVAVEPEAAVSRPAPYAQRLVHYIEDNPTNVEVMRGILGQRPQVRLAVSMLGLDGLAAIRSEPPDLILLDMQLPDISGVELLRHMKNDDALAQIPVIVVSADATPDHLRAALTLGALQYLTKPVDVALFLRHFDEALANTETRWLL
jgi:PAS domain S-box-containing protein